MAWKIGMCGLAGFSGTFAPSLLEAMGARLAHRGPDDVGLLFHEGAGVGLVHRRLSILDPSEAGHQPMVDERTGVAVAFNGEIYNFREIHEAIGRPPLTSRTDTEVLLEACVRLGPTRVLPRLEGIFAFAMFDPRDGSVLLARDSCGVKPLYWAETAAGVLFASELKALLEAPEVSREVDVSAIQRTISHLWTPGPETLLRSVKKLRPGQAQIVRGGRVVAQWTFDVPAIHSASERRSPAVLARDLQETLASVVERQMVSDAPVGAFLSGGLDSSAIVAMARRLRPSERFSCFTVAFGDRRSKVDGFVSDWPYARRVADHLGVDLQTISVDSRLSEHLRWMVYHLDEPLADFAAIQTWLISAAARKQGIKVLLSGTGGDDVFSGYRRHRAQWLERFWAWSPVSWRRALRSATHALPSRSPHLRRLRKMFAAADSEEDERRAAYFRWVEPGVARSLIHARHRGGLDGVEDPILNALRELPDEIPPLKRMLFLERSFFLPDHNLNYADKMGMAASVEIRVPLLDRKLLELAAGLAPDLMQRRLEGKWILKKAMEGVLPDEVIWRPKRGFGVPLRSWLQRELRPLVDEVLSPVALSEHGLLDERAVADLVVADRAGRIDASFPILSLVCIQLWCRLFLGPRLPAVDELTPPSLG